MFRPVSLLVTQLAPTAVVISQGSRDFYVRASHGSLPPHASDMLTVRFGQLTVRGLSPLKIRSLVGCSPNARPVSGANVVSVCFRVEPAVAQPAPPQIRT